MDSKMDPMGRAIAEYWKTKKASKLKVFSPMFDRVLQAARQDIGPRRSSSVRFFGYQLRFRG